MMLTCQDFGVITTQTTSTPGTANPLLLCLLPSLCAWSMEGRQTDSRGLSEGSTSAHIEVSGDRKRFGQLSNHNRTLGAESVSLLGSGLLSSSPSSCPAQVSADLTQGGCSMSPLSFTVGCPCAHTSLPLMVSVVPVGLTQASVLTTFPHRRPHLMHQKQGHSWQ